MSNITRHVVDVAVVTGKLPDDPSGFHVDHQEPPELEQPIRARAERQLVQGVRGDASHRPAVSWSGGGGVSDGRRSIDQSQQRTGGGTFSIVAVATAVLAGLQVVGVDAAAGRANHSEVTAGSDVDGLGGDRKSRDHERGRSFRGTRA
ncbi:hypothetical protein EYF80_064880 [Liparis tanakae]|uniref:Uncharacterized protein n=1 Tax=Liparis tanakae TaxID=230148 RepID=A0A4Z2E9Q1_9TELE|nr:hypothetical protein EYF80_064880 [Liparis tanakae]